MKNKLLALILIISTCQICYSNNGKVAYGYPVKSIEIDGDFSDWGDENWIDLKDGLPLKMSPKDFQGRFQIGYSEKENAVYFIVEISDNQYINSKSEPWYLVDNLAIYFNPQHSETAATASMIVLNNNGIQLVQPDLSHQFLKKNNVVWKMLEKGKTRYYEAKVIFEKGIKANRSIGFDILAIDVDKNKEIKYVNWGKGDEKEYRSGQLGDLVFLSNQDHFFGTVEGKIEWKENIPDALPDVIKIRSEKYPEFWITVEVDSTGNFKANLPTGEYNIQSAYKIASPLADNGSGNQARIDNTYKKKIIIKTGKTENIGVFKIPTYRLPYYLYEKEGVLHSFDSTKTQKVDNFIANICAYYNIPGSSVALIKDGEIVYYKTHGVENLLTQNPVNETILFQAASVTKSVFAFIVLRLVEKGIIDLDKPLHQYLPFTNIAHNEHYKLLTARLVLSHQSGLPNWAWGGPDGYTSGQKADLLFKPGTKYGYSGEAFQYLGRVVEHVTKKDLNQLLKEEVIDALDIPPLFFMKNDELIQARGHYADGRPTFYGMPYKAGVSYSLLTEANAFASFVVALSNKKGLSTEMYQELEKRLAYAPIFDSPDSLYWNVGTSLGFFVQDTPFGKAIMHGGNNGNFQAEFVLYTEKRIGFVVFTNNNTGHKLAEELGKYLIYGRE